MWCLLYTTRSHRSTGQMLKRVMCRGSSNNIVKTSSLVCIIMAIRWTGTFTCDLFWEQVHSWHPKSIPLHKDTQISLEMLAGNAACRLSSMFRVFKQMPNTKPLTVHFTELINKHRKKKRNRKMTCEMYTRITGIFSSYLCADLPKAHYSYSKSTQ